MGAFFNLEEEDDMMVEKIDSIIKQKTNNLTKDLDLNPDFIAN